MGKLGKGKFIRIAIAVFVVAITVWLLCGNVALGLTTYTIAERNLPEAFDGFRIAHISDLHSAELGQNNARLLNMLRKSEPDIIAITGDLIDYRDESPDVAIHFLQEAVKIAPCYYVLGNHEIRLDAAMQRQLLTAAEEAGVVLLHDVEVILQRGDDQISVVGHKWNGNSVYDISYFSGYRILLSHTPEMFPDYVMAGFDLVMCGHIHGGQMRIPFVGGVASPSRTLFPTYDAGVFSNRNTDMVVSRGLGNSSFPLRINNPPELVLIVLQCAEG